MAALINLYWRELKSLVRLGLFEPRCRGCDNPLVLPEEDVICRQCLAKIGMMTGANCKRCSKVLADGLDLCGDCMLKPPPFERNVSYAVYDGLCKDIILLYKYAEVQTLKYLLADLLVRLFRQKVNEDFDYLIPVPRDPGRRREFDHLLSVAKIVSRRLGIPLMKRNLIKIKKTPPQATLPLSRRLRNLNGAFALKQPHLIQDKRLLLLDDVYTTGTTARKCTLLLKKHQAAVTVLTLARSV